MPPTFSRPTYFTDVLEETQGLYPLHLLQVCLFYITMGKEVLDKTPSCVTHVVQKRLITRLGGRNHNVNQRPQLVLAIKNL